MPIKLIVGLGNPGSEYAKTRHNAGFWWVDELCANERISLKPEKKFHGHAARLSVSSHDIWLLQPMTFMNASGRAVQALATFYKIVPEEILVVHDELDLLPATVKMKPGGGHGGHNGLKDIIAQLGTQDFWRLRIGIGHPRELQLEQEVIDFVLKRPSREHQGLIDEAMGKALAVMPQVIAGAMEAAMMQLHSKRAPKDPLKELPKEAQKAGQKETQKETQQQSPKAILKEKPAQ